jgi:hypothetical protein
MKIPYQPPALANDRGLTVRERQVQKENILNLPQSFDIRNSFPHIQYPYPTCRMASTTSQERMRQQQRLQQNK